MSKKRKTSSRVLDWSKYTNFSAQNKKDDLIRLCAKLKRSELKDVFSTRDETGLYPIHWAAIHNRSDFIEFMIDNGSPIRIGCLNKLLANGTAIHLAAINGCIEALDMILSKSGITNTAIVTPPESLVAEEATPLQDSKRRPQIIIGLEERDVEGQTPLMRTAAPKSKRMNTFRDLLRKNLWSLNGRPSETALFLISNGADWRETDTQYGMNLFHLAIINNYEDIVSLLLVIDPQLINIPAKIQNERNNIKKKTPISSKSVEFTTVDLDSPQPSPSSQSSATSSDLDALAEANSLKPLISKRESSKNLISSGLMPLQLAILYGHLSIISLLWRKIESSEYKESSKVENGSSIDPEWKSSKKKLMSEVELRAILMRVFLSNRKEIISFIRLSILKIALMADVALLVLIWMPVYLFTSSDSYMKVNLASGLFILSFTITIALAFRVIYKKPGYLRRNTVAYSNEISEICHLDSGDSKEPNTLTSGQQERATDKPDGSESAKIASRLKTRVNLVNRVRLLCHLCSCIREPRSRHCSHCNRCIQDFDHHCIYLGCCVGRKNRVEFVMMQLLLTLTAIYGTVIMASSLSKAQWRHVSHFIGFIWIFKYVIIGCLSLFLSVRRASQGVTMYEEIRSKRIRRIFGPGGTPDEISKSHRIYSTRKGSFWRYTPNRFLTGDIPLRKIMSNLKEFNNFYSLYDHLISLIAPDSSLARSFNSDTVREDEGLLYHKARLKFSS